MVTSKSFTRLYTISEDLAKAAGTSKEIAQKVLEAANTELISRRREPAVPPPVGGISLGKASKKYHISKSTLSDWAKAGDIITLSITKHCRYVDEKQIKKISEEYKNKNGRGNRTLNKILSCRPNSISS